MDLRAICCALSIHPFGCSRFLHPVDIASLLGHTVIAEPSGILAPPSALVAVTSPGSPEPAMLLSSLNPSVCTIGSTGSVSVGHHPDVGSQPFGSSLISAMACRHWRALGHWPTTIIAARGLSFHYQNRFFQSSCPHHPFATSCLHPFTSASLHCFAISSSSKAIHHYVLLVSLSWTFKLYLLEP